MLRHILFALILSASAAISAPSTAVPESSGESLQRNSARYARSGPSQNLLRSALQNSYLPGPSPCPCPGVDRPAEGNSPAAPSQLYVSNITDNQIVRESVNEAASAVPCGDPAAPGKERGRGPAKLGRVGEADVEAGELPQSDSKTDDWIWDITEVGIDSTKLAAMDSLLAKFYKALEREDLEEKENSADFLISTVSDSLLRQHVAVDIFDYYRYSKLMGDESVAIYVYDKWFDTGKVAFYGEMSKLDADVFVKFNRNSQIGMQAPVVSLYKPDGKTLAIPPKGRTSLLFFHDTSCGKCQLEAKLFPQVLDQVDFDMDFYAVYTGTDKKAWRKFRKEFKVKNKLVHVTHLWDPDMDSGYQLEYGVTGTPRIFMVDPEGTILGRRLEVENVIQLLPYAKAIQDAYSEQIR